MAERLIIVEDDKNISNLLKYNLEKEGYVCACFTNGRKGLEAILNDGSDLIILDIMLPDMSGLDICKRVRSEEALGDVPILMLTAKGEEIDRVLGFELGADDYVVKPFSVRELCLRVKALLRRDTRTSEEGEDAVLKAGDLVIDIARHEVRAGKKSVTLTLMEFKLLKLLIERRGRVQSRDVLLNDVWSIDSEITTRTIDTHIKRLRQKLGRMGNYIETVRGIGYRFKEED